MVAKVRKESRSPDKWNDIVLSLATTGGFIISNGKMAEVHICSPVFNETTHLFENKFLSYWVETRLLKDLYNDVFIQQEELTLHFEDKEEQERIAKERDKAILVIKNKNVQSHGDEDMPDDETDDNSPLEHEN